MGKIPVPLQYVVTGLTTFCAAVVGFALHVNLTTMSYFYLLLVFGFAVVFGFWQASAASVIAAVLLDFFFADPVFHLTISDPQNWVALGVFEAAAIIISRLSRRELTSSREAALHRVGMEQLYELSRNSLLLDLRQPPGQQLVVLIHRIFRTEAVAVFDIHLGRQDRAGEWGDDEVNAAKDAFVEGSVKDDLARQTWRRVLAVGAGPVGALVVRGNLSPLIMDALASLCALALDRHQSFEKEEMAEDASRAEQLRAAVMDALAHEIKTPLTAVQTASSGLLELGDLSAGQRDLVSLIDGETSRMNKLCTRLLMTAKLESGQVGLKTVSVFLFDVVSEVVSGVRDSAQRSRIKAVSDDPAIAAPVDRSLLTMILQQYVDNALKYSTPGTTIEIAMRKSRGEVVISVHNFGSRIRLEDRERVFERFYRGADLGESAPGTGVGLSVVRKAAEAHHGHVWVISDEQDGTTFFLSLPMSERRKLDY